MTAKEYLQQLWHLRGLIKSKEEKIAQLRERAVGCTNRITCDPKAQGVSDKISELISKICDTEARIVADKMRLTQKEREIISRIDALDNLTYRQLLTLRYVNFKKWEQIAVEMDYSYRWMHKIHGKALRCFEKRTLKDTKKCDIV